MRLPSDSTTQSHMAKERKERFANDHLSVWLEAKATTSRRRIADTAHDGMLGGTTGGRL